MIIYRLISPSGGCYIGKTIRSFQQRLSSHIKDWRGGRSIPKLYAAFDEYPPSTWKVEILYSCLDKDTLNAKEKEFIKYYDSMTHGYNLREGGDNASGWNHTDEAKKKVSAAITGRKYSHVALLNKSRAGIKFTDEHRAKIGAASRGRKPSDEARGKMRESSRLRWERIRAARTDSNLHD